MTGLQVGNRILLLPANSVNLLIHVVMVYALVLTVFSLNPDGDLNWRICGYQRNGRCPYISLSLSLFLSVYDYIWCMHIERDCFL